MTGVLIRKEERGSLVSWSPCIPQYAVFLFSTNKLSTNKIFPTSKKKKKEEEEKRYRDPWGECHDDHEGRDWSDDMFTSQGLMATTKVRNLRGNKALKTP
jgi:hypothetical protein